MVTSSRSETAECRNAKASVNGVVLELGLSSLTHPSQCNITTSAMQKLIDTLLHKVKLLAEPPGDQFVSGTSHNRDGFATKFLGIFEDVASKSEERGHSRTRTCAEYALNARQHKLWHQS